MISDWRDYIENAQLLDMNIKNHTIFYPRDLKKAHDIAYQTVNAAVKSKGGLQIPAIAKMEKELNKKYGFETKSLLIRAPHDHHEIIEEGEKLNHCVAGYAKEVAKGKTIILFIRQKAEPDKPYFTLELNPITHSVLQCRGFGNCGYEKDVEKFIEQWKKSKLSKKADTISA